MANFFQPSNKKQILGQHITVKIERLNFNGCGVGKYKNKTIFIEGVLPQEQVEVKITGQKSKYYKGKLIKVIEASEHRVISKCKHFSVCGGCDLQHLNDNQHIDFKQQKNYRVICSSKYKH